MQMHPHRLGLMAVSTTTRTSQYENIKPFSVFAAARNDGGGATIQSNYHRQHINAQFFTGM